MKKERRIIGEYTMIQVVI